MAKINFTSARTNSFQCPAGKNQAFLWDTRAPGLGLRATKAGAKSYVFQGKLHGLTIRLTIGDAKTWAISSAQEEARRLHALVDTGVDPREHRMEMQVAHAARRLESQRQEMTLGEAWEIYVTSRRPHWGELHYHDHVRLAAVGGTPRRRSNKLTQPGPLASLRNIRLAELSGQRLAEWLGEEKSHRPTTTALAFRLLRGFIRWTSDTPDFKGLVPEDAYTARAVRDAIPRARAKEGDVLQKEQLAAWFKAINELPNQVSRVYLTGLLITGARREELAALTWSDVDFKWRGLKLNDKIEGTGGRTIPLTPYFATLLEDLKKTINQESKSGQSANSTAEAGKTNSDWVFASSRARDGRITEPRSAHMRALKAAGLPHLTLHGLRRSFGTLAEWCEVPVGVVAQIQGHKPSAIAEKHYRRRPLDLLRQWHEKIEEWILEQGDISQVSDAH